MTAPIDPFSALPCVSRDELRAKHREEKAEEQLKQPTIDEVCSYS